MRRTPIDEAGFNALADIVAPPPPKKKAKPKGAANWEPSLTKGQKKGWDSTALYLLLHGEKGSGKTYGAVHKLVRIAYENKNALCIILVRERAMATKGGAWDKLMNAIMPEWAAGLGIEYSDVKYDKQQHEYIWIENRFGEWSQILLLSEPHASQLRDTFRGYEPTAVLVDELTACGRNGADEQAPDFLVVVAAQIGRRPEQGFYQYIGACNPEGPSHWVHKKWFVEPYDEETDTWDIAFEQIHIPIQDNAHNLPPGYVESLQRLYKNDPIEAARMLRGEWIDRPSGAAIFIEVWRPALHIKPEPLSKQRILPDPKYATIIGLDPGAVYNAFIFMQLLPMPQGLTWSIYDEVVVLKKRIPYIKLFPVVLRRMAWWRQQVGRTTPVWVSDSSAFNQFRPGAQAGASFDCLELERIAALEQFKPLGLPPVIIRKAPKFSGSVPTRVRLVMDLLGNERIMVSAACKSVISMFNFLESTPQDPKKPFDPELAMTPVRSDHIHVFDALSYPIITGALEPSLLSPWTEGVAPSQFG